MTPKNPEKKAADPAPHGEIHSARISLCGETVQFRTDQSPEVVQRLAGYINAKIKAAGGNTGLTPENFRLLAMAALGITGELFETQARLEDTAKTQDGLFAQARALADSLDRALAAGK